jgi:arginine-tRNA-protein transferase
MAAGPPPPPPRLSLVTDYGAAASPCGYCGSRADTSWSHGGLAETLTPEAFQELLDAGWRRSGRWLYRPDNARTCCELLTIRLDVAKFAPSREQRRALKRWEAYLAGAPLGDAATPAQGAAPPREPAAPELSDEPGGASPKRAAEAAPSPSLTARSKRQRSVGSSLNELGLSEPGAAPALAPPLPATATADAAGELRAALAAALAACVAAGALPPGAEYPPPAAATPSPRQRKALPAAVALTSPFALAVAAAARRAGAPLAPEAAAAALAERLTPPEGWRCDRAGAHLNFSPPPSGQAAAASAAPSPPLATRTSGAVPRAPPRAFELRIVRADDPAIVAVEFPLYRRYQVGHHGDAPAAVTPRSFERFLCDSPVAFTPASARPPGAAPPGGFGSFHHQYWLDGRLAAVGVVDVLPRCLSSVYLFWDPDLRALSLGRLASLLEIEWVRAAATAAPALRRYYLGFYSHRCHRMRYKADFAPSDLLCPATGCWVPVERARAALDAPRAPAALPAPGAAPGALEGLGAEHGVAPDGRPAAPPRPPTPAELDAARLFVPAAAGRQARAAPLRGRVLTLAQLREMGALMPGMEAALRARLVAWMEATGPAAARELVYQIS